MCFFSFTAKKRWYIYTLLLFMFWFQLFITFAQGEDFRAGVLSSPEDLSVIKKLERTGAELVVPQVVSGQRLRVKATFFLFLAAAAVACCMPESEPAAMGIRRAFRAWALSAGDELAALPHSDMVLRN